MLDGAQGEGGGQIVRSAVGLSLLTGKPVRLLNIRAKRKKPGLQRQHLAAVLAAAEIGGAEIEGAVLGSMQLSFSPKSVTPGDYQFEVGTAGSTTLVLQTLLPALLTAEGASHLVIKGGTHNPMAPPFDFLGKAFLPLLQRMGFNVQASLVRHGFFPSGGGEIRVAVEPCPALSTLELMERGALQRQESRILLIDLAHRIGERERTVLRDELGWPEPHIRIEKPARGRGPGNVVIVEIESKEVTEVFTGFGERGLPAERVASGVAKEVRRYLDSGVPVGEHLADQLLIPMALAGGGGFLTLPLSAHTLTNIEVIKRFLPVDISIRETCRNAVYLDVLALTK